MDWSEIRDEWPLVKGLVQHRWCRLSEEDLESISGQRDVLVACLQARYLLNRDMAERQVRDLERLLLTEPGASLC